MAEFQEVMKQAKRMCATYESRCDRCPFGQSDGCPFDFFKNHMQSFDFNEVERIVMEWAAANPEPRYPTWKEWRDETFSDSAYMPCPKNFMSNEASGCVEQPNCPDCMNRPIPADIAEKLGIKPVGGNDNG